ncbi:hypothetical protein BC830DRAFT_601891 [Chytriomyces sp. MP71]|nr:hypothetical protein BC830DRAFT_601891 [Chytriomyces sp. MP71]
MAKTQTLIDQETLIYLDKQREDDNVIVRSIEAEHESIGFIFEHSERFNNWKTDELYVERARLAEAAFLEKIHAQEQESMKKRQFEEDVSQKLIEDDQNTFSFIVNEMKSLKVQCDLNNVAAEKIKRGKNIMKERRLAAQAQLARVKALQERERKSLEGTHARKLKMTELARNVQLREVEDAEIRVVLRGLEFNEKTAADETARSEALIQKERKNHHARVLNQLMRNQKEIEQMREVHLLQQRYISRYIDYELEIIDENEALLSEHTSKEQALEDHQKIQADVEENVMKLKLIALQRNQNERAMNHQASRAKERQHRDAKLLAFKDAREARRREKTFWFRELDYLHAELKRGNLPTEGPAYFAKREELLPGIPKDLEVEIDDALLFDDDDDVLDESSSFDEINVEAARAREVALFETMKKSQKDAVKKLRNEQHRFRETKRMEHQKNLRAIRAAQETEPSEATKVGNESV